jgi:twitching motility protein PilT
MSDINWGGAQQPPANRQQNPQGQPIPNRPAPQGQPQGQQRPPQGFPPPTGAPQGQQRPQGLPVQGQARPVGAPPQGQQPAARPVQPQGQPQSVRPVGQPVQQRPAVQPGGPAAPQFAPPTSQPSPDNGGHVSITGDVVPAETNQDIEPEAMVQTKPAAPEKPAWYKKIEAQIMLWAETGVSDIQMISDNYVWIVDDDNHQPTSLWLTTDDILLLADYWVPGNKAMDIINGAKQLAEGKEGTLETVQTLGRSFASDSLQSWRSRIIFRRQENGYGVTMRLIPPTVPTLAKYPQPQQIMDLLKENNGLFIVSGPTGSGKTTLLAALLNEYNETNHRHIYTIEDPIEFVHLPKKSLVTQREVGRDVDDWEGGIMAAVRSKAQVIMIGELRELPAIIAALDAANKGHLVFATSHASSAAQCIEGIVSQFPPGQQNLVQNRIAEVIKCVMVQRLVPAVDGKLIAVREIMLDHTTTTPNIRNGDFTKLTNALKEEDGMISFEQSLFYLFEANKITEETALKFANIKNDLVFKIDRLKQRRREVEGRR